MKKYILGICVLNEGQKIQRVIKKFNDYDLYDVAIFNDGSSDNSLVNIQESDSLKIIQNPRTSGAGYGVRKILEYAKGKGYEAVFFVSGNDKDEPQDIYKLKDAIEEGYDLVQGSRYLKGGEIGAMPAYRFLATRFIRMCVLI